MLPFTGWGRTTTARSWPWESAASGGFVGTAPHGKRWEWTTLSGCDAGSHKENALPHSLIRGDCEQLLLCCWSKGQRHPHTRFILFVSKSVTCPNQMTPWEGHWIQRNLTGSKWTHHYQICQHPSSCRIRNVRMNDFYGLNYYWVSLLTNLSDAILYRTGWWTLKQSGHICNVKGTNKW